jgi:hypothetical protein
VATKQRYELGAWFGRLIQEATNIIHCFSRQDNFMLGSLSIHLNL